MASVESTAPPPVTIPSSAATQSAQIEEIARGQPEASIAQVEEAAIEPKDEPEYSEPEMAESTADDHANNVVTFPTQKSRCGRKRKTVAETLRVDYVKESVNTMTFRIRWKEMDGSEPVIAVSRVSDQFFKSIRKQKGKYVAFKKQLIAGYKSRAIRQGDRTDASAHRNV
ncbi:MAG: hypothetical protein ABI977_02145 [Acidobacteriota bacterium]